MRVTASTRPNFSRCKVFSFLCPFIGLSKTRMPFYELPSFVLLRSDSGAKRSGKRETVQAGAGDRIGFIILCACEFVRLIGN